MQTEDRPPAVQVSVWEREARASLVRSQARRAAMAAERERRRLLDRFARRLLAAGLLLAVLVNVALAVLGR